MTRNVGRELLNVPFPELVFNLGVAIAEAQYKLDLESIEILKIMGEEDRVSIPTPAFKDEKGNLQHNINTSMIGAGFQPTFYQFAETIIEVKMAISMSEEKETLEKGKKAPFIWSPAEYYYPFKGRVIRARRVIYSTPIDAKYTNKYAYHQEGESTLRTRLVPVPPNTIMQRFIDLKAMEMEGNMQQALEAIEKAQHAS